MKRSVLILFASGIALVASSLWACSVPVFRYALERWPADRYEVVLFHRGELKESEQKILRTLSPRSQENENFANVRLHTVDLDANPSEDQLAMWKEQKSETLPWLVVKYPLATRNLKDVWAGSLSEDVVRQLIASPLRQQVARGLLKGESAVWVLLEGGDEKKDDKAYKLINDRLKQLAGGLLKLPEIEEKDVSDGLIDIDPDKLKLSFSLLRLSRNDPAERMFVNMLLGSEGDLRDAEFDGQPMAFPIFGRGRALYALVGRGITAENIDEACTFLVGPCSCQVKNENPGTDLLMAVDWDTLVDPTVEIDKELPPLTGLGAFAAQSPSQAETVALTSSETPAADDGDVHSGAQTHVVTQTGIADHAEVEAGDDASSDLTPMMRNTLIVAAVGVLVVMLASIALLSRKS